MGSVVLFILFLAMVVAGVILLRWRRSVLAKAEVKTTPNDVPAQEPRSAKSRGRTSFGDRPSSYDYESVKTPEPKKSSATFSISTLSGGWALIVIGAFMAVFMCLSTVSAKNVGVVVTFGAVDQQTRSSGINAKLPWSNMVEIDGTIQTDEYSSDHCIPVRIGDGSQACAYITNRWSINADKGAAIYENFRSDDPTQAFRSAVVSTQLEASVQKALKDYNPIAQLKIVQGDALSSELSFAPDYDAVSLEIEADMRERLSDDALAEIESITFSYLRLAENTQKKLDDYVAAIGETRIAMQKEQTAQAQANANRTLSDSVSNDPNVLVSKCFDTVAEAVASGYQLPAGFSCWGGSSAVVIPGAGAQIPSK